jgi:hypothetical protein
MLVWGSGGNTVEAVRDAGVAPCPVCKGNQPFRLMLNYRYGHIWHLFGWVTSRQYLCLCTRCNHGYAVEPRAIADRLGARDPIPFMRRRGWLVGVVALTAVVATGVTVEIQRSQAATQYVEAPRVGDLYRAELSKISKGFTQAPVYGLMRLEAVAGDHLVFRIAGKGYTLRKGADRDITTYAYRNAQYFSAEIVRLPWEQVKQMRAQSVIYAVDRVSPTP